MTSPETGTRALRPNASASKVGTCTILAGGQAPPRPRASTSARRFAGPGLTPALVALQPAHAQNPRHTDVSRTHRRSVHARDLPRCELERQAGYTNTRPRTEVGGSARAEWRTSPD